jgi:hypothetical protein
MKTTKTDKIYRYILAALISSGFFALLLFLVKYSIPVENKELLYIVVGALIGAFGTIVNYEWGSSRSSSEKNEMIKTNMEPTNPEQK